jgi:hypothetical protein
VKFTPSNRDDLIRYYKGTFVKFAEFGEQLFYIDIVTANRIEGKHESGENFIMYLDEATPYEVGYILPHKSFFQYGQDACLLQRNPAKQYHRGLCSQNTNITLMTATGPKALGIGFETLKAFVSKQQFYTLSGAIGAEDKNSCVLNSRMMYHREKRMIYVDMLPIAKVNPAKTTVSLLKPIFKDEVTDWMKSTAENSWKVEIYVPSPRDPKESKINPDLKTRLEQSQAAKKKLIIPQYAAPVGVNLAEENYE